jgi:hypothetical protein
MRASWMSLPAAVSPFMAADCMSRRPPASTTSAGCCSLRVVPFFCKSVKQSKQGSDWLCDGRRVVHQKQSAAAASTAPKQQQKGLVVSCSH